MYRPLLATLYSVVLSVTITHAQETPLLKCGQQEATHEFLRQHPAQRQYHDQVEQQMRQYQQVRRSATKAPTRTTAVVTLPVVVHLIHNNGAENISNAQVLAGIQHLNEAFANTGYYDPADGVNTQIQFCLAQRDPAGNPTNGITRDLSPLTVMNGPNHYSDDFAVKNLNRWDPSCYINIWLVRSIPGNVAGYAYLPAAHGQPMDGILMEATYFGSSPANSVVTIHEMGHYLGLYHTFEGACQNNDCTTDGDRVCDTPPDQSTASTGCNTNTNSCSTDALSGFSTDRNDLKEDYMDYGNLNCMKVFTQGQADRMNWFVQHVRVSLQQCKSCQSPCPAPVTAAFTASATSISTGTNVTFTNGSVNASQYKWYLNDAPVATTADYNYTFNIPGTYTVKMSAHSSNPLCDSAAQTATITVTCPVKVQFTPPDTTITVNNTLIFTNGSTGATSYQWFLDGIPQSTAPHFTHTFATTGYYRIKLLATDGSCTDSLTRLVIVVNPCLTETFQRAYGGASYDQAFDMRTTSDGGSIVAGKSSSFSTGHDDGYLVKLDDKGQVLWSQTYGGVAEDVFYRVLPTADGGYIAVGQTRSYSLLTGAAWVVKVNATGAVQWNRQFGENSPNGEIASNVLPTSDGGYVITGRQNNSPSVGNVLVIKLDANGNILWSKVYDDSDSDNGSAILEDNGDVLVAGTSRSPTWHDAFLMKLNGTNGIVIWAKKYDIGGRNNSGGTVIYRQGNRYLLPVFTIDNFSNTNTGRTMVLQTDLDGNAVDVQEIIAPDYAMSGSGSFAPTSDGGYITQYNENNIDPDLNLVKVSAAGAVEWAYKYPRANRQTNLALRLTPDGGYISAGTHVSTSFQDFLVIRTDALGQTPGCPSAPVPVTVNWPSFTSTPFTWDAIRNTSFVGNLTPAVQTQTPATQNTLLCNGNSCVLPPDPCISTFQKTYSAPGSYQAFYIHTTADGGSVIAGTANPVAGARAGSATTDALAMKLTPAGEIVWAKRIGGNAYDEFRKIKPVSDGGYIAIGNSHSYTGAQHIYLVKLTATGDVSWSKNFNSRTQNGDYGLDVIETADGGFAFTGTLGALPPTASGVIAKTDANGNITWARTFKHGYGTDFSSVLENADTLVISADYWVDFEQKYYGSLFKLNKFTGAVISAVQFSSDNRSVFAPRVYKTPTGFLVGMHLIDGANYSNKQQGILTLDQNLQPLSNQKLQAPDISPWSYPVPLQNGGYLLTTSQRDAAGNFQMIKADGAGTLFWKKGYADIASLTGQTAANAQPYADGTYIAASTYTEQASGNNGRIHVVKASSNGTTPGCNTPDVQQTMLPAPITVQTLLGTTINTFTYQTPTDVLSTATPLQLTVNAVCAAGNCQFNGVTGKDSICIRTDTLTYEVQRNPECTLPAVWTIDPAYAQVIASTDSTIRLLFKKAGPVTLYAAIQTACVDTRDSLAITVFDTVAPLNLGPDIQLCNISTWPLKAGTGYKTYLWQDNSSDSNFTAYGPGMYHVLAADHCNQPYRDTVVITPIAAAPFHLGPDLERCPNDTLVLTAPAGFTNYRWTDNYKINTAYGRTIRIFTDKDTLYSVTAEQAPGCLVMDTIRVTVKQVAPLYLGPDTSFCRNATIQLDAGSGFLDYTWSTGELTQQTTVGSAGPVWVAATNANGCLSRDTLQVNTLYKLPDIHLGKDTTLCNTEPLLLQAGSNFATYEWQDGSTLSTFTPTQPGKYWVKVTDIHTCENADTINVTGVKDCRQYLYMPSAFSPNSDQQNDLFRPRVNGFVDKYKLTIYNRWGERIFETTDPYRGWDGTYKGVPQPSGSFVWTCQYKLAGTGQEEKKEKGVLVLVR